MDHECTEDEFRRDEMVQLAARVLVRRPGRVPAPPEIDVTHLLTIAHERRMSRATTSWWARWRRQHRTPLWRRFGRWGPAVSVAAVLVLLVGGIGTLRPDGLGGPATPEPTGPDSAGPGEPGLRPPTPVTAGRGVTPARHQLASVARYVATLPAAASTGRYTYVHLQTWWAADPATGQPIGGYDQRLWWAADRSGQAVRTHPAAPDSTPDVFTYQPGTLGVAVIDPAEDRTVLAGQLAEEQPLDEGPQAVLRSVVGLYRFHDLSPPQRAAVLAVLADADLYTHGPVLDRAGRSGVAISATGTMDGAAVRDTVVVDTATGRLLSYERVALPDGAVDAAGTLTHYLVFLRSGRVDQLGGEPGS
ncbi:hypothetical protein [Micromonospora sp. NBC_01813]|uniref:hypothetical protein n=1 Tax=Micromonospora sp. NBC_01813 TaxID=2975988 RepID=UPI002DD803FA|nr:hypothetical protein [Micromonospora sp. NBC_01813]WSA07181.1 hypothetical protein OG958_23365 [Micromonospora sp. NBC_01813]